MAYLPPIPDSVISSNSSTTPLISLAVTNASYSGSSLVLTGAWVGGGSSAYVGFVFYVSGFIGAAVGNNSSGSTGFVCTASSAGSITLTVIGGYNGFTGSPVASQMFIGTAVDCTASSISSATVFSFSDKVSLVNGAQLQWSQDGTNWDKIQDATAYANNCAFISDKVRGRYFRAVYINGSTTQTYFRLQTMVSSTNTSGTVRDLDTNVGGDDEAQLVRAVITGTASLGTPPNAATGIYTQVVTDVYGSQQVVIGGQAADAFGRMRIANPISLFDTQFQYDNQPLLFQTQSVGGSVTKTSGESSLTLSTGGTTLGNFATNQTKQYMRYEPGKSQQIMMTGFLGGKVSNVRSEIGYSDANDGVFFRMDGTLGACVVMRSSVPGVSVGPIPQIALTPGSGSGYAVGDTGTINNGNADATYIILAVSGGVPTAIMLTGAGTGYTTALANGTTKGGTQAGSGTGMTVNILNETVTAQANWNFDKMDGTGVSGVTLDFSKCQVFAVDFQWLGVGRVRFGFFINGALIICHQIFNANVTTAPYMNTPNLPCRAFIQNTGTASGTTTMKQVCMAVISEGGVENPVAFQFSAVSGVGSATSTPTGVRTPLVSIQPKTTFNSITNRGGLRPVAVTILCTPGAAQPVYWELVYNPTLAGSPSFASVDPNSLVNFDRAASGTILTVTGSTYSGSTKVITGSWLGGANNQYLNQWVTLSGFSTTANNGVWLCTASSAGSISLTVPYGNNSIAGTPVAEGRGQSLQSGMAVATDSTKDTQLTTKVAITLDILGLTPDTLSLCVTGLGSGAPGAWGSITWEEIR